MVDEQLNIQNSEGHRPKWKHKHINKYMVET